ncbi:hypothetical protein M0812_13291 [Anaeramoeba flamelloides]|uniref:B box-type domain-containing protein n=1 Tax=Anaeramoeba flamelloides TaxID=1746091 RepID=A0AAV7ZLU1_9EUKA|nr:hypothetical protein M0812_13291 [Anaeramoeba flamelloides]
MSTNLPLELPNKKHLCDNCKEDNIEKYATVRYIKTQSRKPTEEEKVPNCQIHQNKQYQFFCRTCNAILCESCTLLHPRKHDYQPLQNAIELCQVNQQDLLDLGVTLEKENTFLEKLKNESNKINELELSVLKELKEEVTNLILKIQEKQKVIKKEIKNEIKKKNKKINNQIKITEEKIKKLSESEKKYKTLEEFKQRNEYWDYLLSYLQIKSNKKIPTLDHKLPKISYDLNTYLLPFRSTNSKLNLKEQTKFQIIINYQQQQKQKTIFTNEENKIKILIPKTKKLTRSFLSKKALDKISLHFSGPANLVMTKLNFFDNIYDQDDDEDDEDIFNKSIARDSISVVGKFAVQKPGKYSLEYIKIDTNYYGFDPTTINALDQFCFDTQNSGYGIQFTNLNKTARRSIENTEWVGIRGRNVIKRGVHTIKLLLDDLGKFGYGPMIGVCNPNVQGVNWFNSKSWMVYSDYGDKRSNQTSMGKYGRKMRQNEVITLIVDMNKKETSYIYGTEKFGVAFRDLPNNLALAVDIRYKDSQITLLEYTIDNLF